MPSAIRLKDITSLMISEGWGFLSVTSCENLIKIIDWELRAPTRVFLRRYSSWDSRPLRIIFLERS
jgi:hypothetical protein